MTRRAGIALVAALSLLALLGLLIAGAVASTAVAQRSVRLAVTEGMTSSAADYALATLLADPDTYGLADAPVGRPRTFSVASDANVSTTVVVTRLANGVLWLVADASVTGVDQGHRRVGLIARFPSIGALPASGVVSRGSASLGSVEFSADSSGDADCARTPSAPAVQATDSASLYLAHWQTAVLDSVPGVLRVRGDTTIVSGTFHGILLVDGSLTVTGNWSATGLIVARGPVRTTGNIEVVGALMSSAGGSAIDVSAGRIRYAPCIVAREIRAAVPPRSVAGRAWAELF
jgi:hypothetical protein